MSLSYGKTCDSLANRRDFLSFQGIDYRDLVCAKQVHSCGVHYATEADKGRGAQSYESAIDDIDALITDKRGLPLAVFTADCLSVFLFDPARPAVGLVHAGWRSSREQIISKTIERMKQEFKSKPQELLASFGPALRQCCFEVDKEFNDYFPSGINSRDSRYYCDLARINRKELLDSGLKAQNLSDSGICTSCSYDRYFSFRREGKDCGRMLSVIMLR